MTCPPATPPKDSPGSAGAVIASELRAAAVWLLVLILGVAAACLLTLDRRPDAPTSATSPPPNAGAPAPR